MVWTPRFIIGFALLVVLGLSGATVLTNGMLNGYYAPVWILLAWALGCSSCLFVVAVRARSVWMRLGSGMGCLWGVLSGLTGVLIIMPQASGSVVPLYAATAGVCALTACSVCLSIGRTLWGRWDTVFFYTAPVIAGLIVTGAFLLSSRSWPSLALSVLVVLPALNCAIWWLRPSCWHGQAGPALLFGLAPLLLLGQVLPN